MKQTGEILLINIVANAVVAKPTEALEILSCFFFKSKLPLNKWPRESIAILLLILLKKQKSVTG